MRLKMTTWTDPAPQAIGASLPLREGGVSGLPKHAFDTHNIVVGIFCAFVGVLCALPASALAEADGDVAGMVEVGESYGTYLDVVHSLTEQGYMITIVENTLLNRVRIQSERGRQIRETIVSQSTGAILRDATWQKR